MQDDGCLGGVSPTLQCKMRDALRQVAAAANQFTSCGQSQETALVTVRSLKKVASNPEVEEVAATLKERTQMWEKAREQRKKFVTLQSMKAPLKSVIQTAVSKMPNSKLGVSNRLFVWSADLVVEGGRSPWNHESSPKNT